MTPPPPRSVSAEQILSLLDKHAAGEQVSLDIGYCTIWAGQPDTFVGIAAYALQAEDSLSRQLAWQAIAAWQADANCIKWLVANLEHPDEDIRTRATNKLLSRFPTRFAPDDGVTRKLDGQIFLPYLSELMRFKNSDLQTRYNLAMTLASLKGIDEQVWPLNLSFLDDPAEQIRTVAISGISTMPERALQEPDTLVCCFERLVALAEILAVTSKSDPARTYGLLAQLDGIMLRIANLITQLPMLLTDDVGALAKKAAELFRSPATRSALGEVAALAGDSPCLPGGLLEMVNSSAPYTRVSGIRALGFLGAKSRILAAAASAQILATLVKEDDAIVRAAGMLAWRDMGQSAGQSAVDYLCSTLSDRHIYNFRECAAAALAFVSSAKCQKTIEVLQGALIDSNPRVRSAAGFALSQLTGIEQNWRDEFINQHICKQEIEASPSSALPPHLSLGGAFNLTFPPNENSTEAYLNRLADTDPIVRDDALSSLANEVIMSSARLSHKQWQLENPEEHADKLALVESWLNNQDPVLRRNSMSILPLFGSKAHHLAHRVVEELSQNENRQQTTLPQIIVAIGEPSSIESLVKMIGTTCARTDDILEALGARLDSHLEALLKDSRTQLEVLASLWQKHAIVPADLLFKVLETNTDNISMNYLIGPCTATRHINARSIAIEMAMRNYPNDERLLAQISFLAQCENPLVRSAAQVSLQGRPVQ